MSVELVDVYNKNREALGITRDRNSLNNGEYRLSSHIWILSNDKLLVQKRTADRKKFPNFWEQTGGGVLAGETSKLASLRECKEELGLEVKDTELSYIGSYVRTKDIVDIWLVNKNIKAEDLILQKDEVADAKLVTFEEFDEMIKQGVVVPTIDFSYTMFKNYYNSYIEK